MLVADEVAGAYIALGGRERLQRTQVEYRYVETDECEAGAYEREDMPASLLLKLTSIGITASWREDMWLWLTDMICTYICWLYITIKSQFLNLVPWD